MKAIDCWNAAREAENRGERERTVVALAACAWHCRKEGLTGLLEAVLGAQDRVYAGGRI